MVKTRSQTSVAIRVSSHGLVQTKRKNDKAGTDDAFKPEATIKRKSVSSVNVSEPERFISSKRPVKKQTSNKPLRQHNKRTSKEVAKAQKHEQQSPVKKPRNDEPIPSPRLSQTNTSSQGTVESDDDFEEVTDYVPRSVIFGDKKALEITVNKTSSGNKEDLQKEELEREKKRIRRFFKEKSHQINLLFQLAHLKFLNNQIFNDSLLKSIALSLVPIGYLKLTVKSLTVNNIEKFLKWFCTAIEYQYRKSDITSEFRTTKFRLLQMLQAQNCTTYKDYACLFIIFCRSLGWPCRLIASMSNRDVNDFEDEQKNDEEKLKHDEDCDSHQATSRPDRLSRGLKKYKMEPEREKYCDFWAEIYCESMETWIAVNFVEVAVNEPKSFENNATTPILYALAVDEKSSIKDITARYSSKFYLKSFRLLRKCENWWQKTLDLEYFKPKANLRQRLEDLQLKKNVDDLPFPKTIADFKHHPTYVLKRDLLKFEVIYPLDSEPVALFRDEPVFLRKQIRMLHTRETWLKEARSVKANEQPVKLVKGRPKPSSAKVEEIGRMIPVFGEWQTEPYDPPVAKDGKVPRNHYGNVDLFKPSMLPKGTVHLKNPGLMKIARKLNIDCVEAMTGWDFHGGWSHPTFDGVVVCQEFEQVLLVEWDKEQAINEAKEMKKKSSVALKNWARLCRCLILREKLRKKFSTNLVDHHNITDFKKDQSSSADLSKSNESSLKTTTSSHSNTAPKWSASYDEFTFRGHN